MTRLMLDKIAEAALGELLAHAYRCEHCYHHEPTEARAEQLCAPGARLHRTWQSAERDAAWFYTDQRLTA